MYKLLITAIQLLTSPERKRLYWLTAFQAIICLVDLAALALLVLAVASLNPTSAFFSQVNSSPVVFFVLLMIIFLLKNYLGFIIQQNQFRLVYAIAARLSKEGLANYLNGPFEDYTEIDSSVWVRRISQQPIEFAQYVLTGFQSLFTESLLVAGATTLLLVYHAPLFLLLLSILLPAMLAVLYFTKKRLQHVRKSIKTNSERNLQYLQESLHAYVESNLFEKHIFFTGRYGAQQAQLNRHLAQLQSTNVLPSRMMESFAVAGFCLLAIFQFSGIADASIPLLTLGAFFAGAYKLIPGIVRIINACNSIKTFAFTAWDFSRVSGSFTQRRKGSKGAKQMGPMKEEQKIVSLHAISFHEVSFSIGNKTILKDVNFQVQPGVVTGMTAPSGKGKTTLINLLLGFCEITSGKILFNDIETDALTRKKYWSRISYVKQQPFVLRDTLEQNITLEGQSENARVDKAIQAVRLHKWLPQDVASALIFEGGKNISGGQQQRIALARALHKDADCYILDEPFHALDATATNEMIDHLESLADAGKMILVISHDPHTIQRCRQIITFS